MLRRLWPFRHRDDDFIQRQDTAEDTGLMLV